MCLGFPKTRLGVRLGSETGGPGSRMAAGSSVRRPVTQTPKIALPFRERGEETRSRWPCGLPGLILQVRKVGLQPKLRVMAGRQKGPRSWAALPVPSCG